MTKKSITRNFIFNTILTMSSFIFPLISFPYVSRVLMADGLGRVTFASSIIDYALTFAMLGMPLYGVKVCVGYIKNKEKLSQTVRELLVINLLVGFLVMLLLATMVIIIPRFRQEWQLIIITSSTIPLNIIGIEWLYKALEDYSYISIRTLTFKILGFLLMFLVVRTKDDYMVYAAITVLASHGSFILNFFRSRTFLLENISQRLNLKQHIKPLLILFFLSVSWTIYKNTDVVMMGFLTSDTEIGYYSTALKIRSIVLSVVTSLGTVVLPRLVKYYKEGKYNEAKKILNKSSSFIMLSSLYFIGYIVINAREIILFIAGRNYLGAIPTLQVSIFSAIFVGYSIMYGTNILVSIGKENVTIQASIIGVVLNICLNFIMIPKFAALGAGIATSIGEAVMVLYEIIYLGKDGWSYFERLNILKIIVVFIFSTFMLYIMKDFFVGYPLFIYIVISGVIYSIIYIFGLMILRENLLSSWKISILNRFNIIKE